MRIGVIDGRAVLITADGAGIDIANASDGRFGPDPMAIYEEWEAFVPHARTLVGSGGHATASSPDDGQWGIPVPRPRQVFAVGMNYAEHAQEAGVAEPTEPAVFTKFVTSSGTRQSRKFRSSYVADAGGSVSEAMHAVSRRRI
jgi:2,4-didehydro-3-deoxy-L-rhamnonate hydrolase